MVEDIRNIRGGHDLSNEDDSEEFDLDRVRELVGFVFRAARRWPKLASGTFVIVAALGVAVAAVMPRTYTSTVKLLAQRASAMRVLTSQTPAMDGVDNPTKNVAAMILRRDNLVSLANDGNIVQRFEQTRPPPLRLKDKIIASLFGAPSEKDKLLGIVGTLETKLTVTTPDEATLVITVDWSNPNIAFDLATLVQKNFLEARYDSDVAVINDSIAVLEEHAKNELARVDSELEAYQKMLASRTATTVGSGPALPRGLGAMGPRPGATGASSLVLVDPELTKALEEKRRQIRAMDEAQQHTLDSLRQQLVQAQLTLTPMHPSVIALQQQIETVSQPSPTLAQLRGDERSLMAQIVAPRAAPPPTGSVAAPAAPSLEPPAPMPIGNLERALDRDGPLQLARARLESAIHSYEDAMRRIDGARVELDITRTAYKHKYTVVSPAELPKKPKKSTASIGFAAVVGGALLALLLAAALDLLGGWIIEPWQIRRRLKLDILGEFDRPV